MYKISKYNYCVNLDDSVIYFNGFTGVLFPLKKIEHDRIQSLFKDCISFEINYPSVFNKLKEWGFIVDDSLDEVDRIRLCNKLTVFDNEYYNLILNPTLECNFNCWYCYENHVKGKMSKETIEKIKKHVDYIVKEKQVKNFNLAWFGGEPLLYFDDIIYPLSIYAKEVCKDILYSLQITTNAYLITLDMINRMKEIGVCSFQITIDGEETTHNKIRNEKGIPSFSKIIENVILICENIPGVRISLRFNYTDSSLNDSLITVLDKIPLKYRKNISPYFQRIWQTYKKSDILTDNEILLSIRKECKIMGYSISLVDCTFRVGKYHACYMDRINTVMINCDSKIYTCTARNYSEKYVLGELNDLGKIVWDMTAFAKKYGRATFENNKCVECKHLPICFGACSQVTSENRDYKVNNYCRLSVTEVTPETFIIERYKSFYASK